MPRVTITVPEKTPQPYRFQLDRKSVTLGRGSDNDIAIDCGSVSVKHAEMRRVDGGYELRDLGSTNGIKQNGERREVIRLRNGQAVTLGDVEFDFLLTDEELDALAAEKSDAPMELPPLKDLPPEPDTEDLEPDESSGGGFGMVLLFLILAAAAFAAGMAVRYQKETGDSWLDAVKARMSAPAAPAPAADEAAPGEE
jgi:pSer/pThr/pTyr-binding forkhead associated (FHA) protein